MIQPLSAFPLLVGTLAHQADLLGEPLATQLTLNPPDLLELRLDGLPEAPWSQLPPDHPPLLLTCRDPLQGGARILPLPQRLAILQQALPQASALDWELDHFAAAADLLSSARAQGTLIVASAHDFDRTPGASELQALISRAVALPQPPDLLKIACRLNSPADLARLLSLLENPPLPLALMGMGPLGPASRLTLTAAGSRLIYGYLLQANAPGQSSVAELRSLEKLWRISEN